MIIEDIARLDKKADFLTGANLIFKGALDKINPFTATQLLVTKNYLNARKRVQELQRNPRPGDPIQHKRLQDAVKLLHKWQDRMTAEDSVNAYATAGAMGINNGLSNVKSTLADTAEFVAWGDWDAALKKYRAQQEAFRNNLRLLYVNQFSEKAGAWWDAGNIASQIGAEALTSAIPIGGITAPLKFMKGVNAASRIARNIKRVKGLKDKFKAANRAYRSVNKSNKFGRGLNAIDNFINPSYTPIKDLKNVYKAKGLKGVVKEGGKFLAGEILEDITGDVLASGTNAWLLKQTEGMDPLLRLKFMAQWAPYLNSASYALPNTRRSFYRRAGLMPGIHAGKALNSFIGPTVLGSALGKATHVNRYTAALLERNPALLVNNSNFQVVDPSVLNPGVSFLQDMGNILNWKNRLAGMSIQLATATPGVINNSLKAAPTLIPRVFADSKNPLRASNIINTVTTSPSIQNVRLENLDSLNVYNKTQAAMQYRGALLSLAEQAIKDQKAGKNYTHIKPFTSKLDAMSYLVHSNPMINGSHVTDTAKLYSGWNPYEMDATNTVSYRAAKTIGPSTVLNLLDDNIRTLEAYKAAKDPELKYRLQNMYLRNQDLLYNSALSRAYMDFILNDPKLKLKLQQALGTGFTKATQYKSLEDLSDLAQTARRLKQDSLNNPAIRRLYNNVKDIDDAYKAQIASLNKQLELAKKANANPLGIRHLRNRISLLKRRRILHTSLVKDINYIQGNAESDASLVIADKLKQLLLQGKDPYKLVDTLWLMASENNLEESAGVDNIKTQLKQAIWKDLQNNPSNLNKAFSALLKTTFGTPGKSGGFMNSVADSFKDPLIGYGVPAGLATLLLSGLLSSGKKPASATLHLSDYERALQRINA